MNSIFNSKSKSSEIINSDDNIAFMNYNYENNRLRELYDIIKEQNRQIKVLEKNQYLILKALKIPQIEYPTPIRPKTVCTESSIFEKLVNCEKDNI